MKGVLYYQWQLNFVVFHDLSCTVLLLLNCYTTEFFIHSWYTKALRWSTLVWCACHVGCNRGLGYSAMICVFQHSLKWWISLLHVCAITLFMCVHTQGKYWPLILMCGRLGINNAFLHTMCTCACITHTHSHTHSHTHAHTHTHTHSEGVPETE